MSGWGKERPREDRRVQDIVPPDSNLWEVIAQMRENSSTDTENIRKKPKSGRQATRSEQNGHSDHSLHSVDLVVLPLGHVNGHITSESIALFSIPEAKPVYHSLPEGDPILPLPPFCADHFVPRVPPRDDKYKKPSGSTVQIFNILSEPNGKANVSTVEGLNGFDVIEAVACLTKQKMRDLGSGGNQKNSEILLPFSISRIVNSVSGLDLQTIEGDGLNQFVESLCKSLPGKDKRDYIEDVTLLVSLLSKKEATRSLDHVKHIEHLTVTIPSGFNNARSSHRLFRFDASEIDGLELTNPKNKRLSVVFARVSGEYPTLAVEGVYTRDQYRTKFRIHKNRE